MPLVNPAISDAIASANTTQLGLAPAMALSQLYLATATALSLAAQNATLAQQQGNLLLQATTTRGVALILGVDTGAQARTLARLAQRR